MQLIRLPVINAPQCWQVKSPLASGMLICVAVLL